MVLVRLHFGVLYKGIGMQLFYGHLDSSSSGFWTVFNYFMSSVEQFKISAATTGVVANELYLS